MRLPNVLKGFSIKTIRNHPVIYRLINGSSIQLEVRDFTELNDSNSAKIQAVLRSQKDPDLLFDREATFDHVAKDFAGNRYDVPQKIPKDKFVVTGRLNFSNGGFLRYKGHYAATGEVGRPSDLPEGYSTWRLYDERKKVALENALKVREIYCKPGADQPEKRYEQIELEIQNQVRLVLGEDDWFMFG